jgi:hypothetical protein
VPNKRDARGVTESIPGCHRCQCLSRPPEENRLRTLLGLPAVDPLAELGRQKALNGVEDAEHSRKGDPPGQGAAQGSLGWKVVGDDVSDGYGHDVLRWD